MSSVLGLRNDKVLSENLKSGQITWRKERLAMTESIKRVTTLFMVAIVGAATSLVSFKLALVLTPAFYLAHEFHAMWRNEDEMLRNKVEHVKEHCLTYGDTPILNFLARITGY